MNAFSPLGDTNLVIVSSPLDDTTTGLLPNRCVLLHDRNILSDEDKVEDVPDGKTELLPIALNPFVDHTLAVLENCGAVDEQILTEMVHKCLGVFELC